MDMDKFVTVRLTVESLRHQVLHALTGIEGDVAKAIERQLDDEIKTFDFASLVKETLSRELHGMIRDQLTAAFGRLRYDPAIRAGFVQQIVSELRANLAAEEIANLRSQVEFWKNHK